MANEKTMTETSTKDIEATEAIEVPARHRWRLITQKHQLLSRRLRSLLLICFGIFSFFFVGALWSTWILWTSGACQGLSCLGCDRASGGVCRSFNLKHGPTTGAQSPWFDELRQSHEGGTATGPSLPPLTTSAFSESSDTNQLSLNHIPSYVLRHAPLIHLYSQEEFWPCDMAEHLHHVTPFLDYDPAPEAAQHVNLSNLYQLNRFGRDVFLQSKDNVEDRPAWLLGRRNIPKEDDDSEDGNYRYSILRRCQQIIAQALTKLTSPLRSLTRYITRARGGRSTAPAILIVVPKPDGIVDAFWFFFYSYNLGNQVLNVRFGNHVGDWEHTLVRFHHGKPKAVYFSEHNFGAAYSWEAVEKIGKRVSSRQRPHSRCPGRVNAWRRCFHWHKWWPRFPNTDNHLSAASWIFWHRHACHVRYCWRAPLRSPLGPSGRPHGPRPTMGSCTQRPHIHLLPARPRQPQ